MNCDYQIDDLTLADLNKYSLDLAKKIWESGYKVDHVLYLERAGLFVGDVIAKYFDCTMSGIYASRSGGIIKSKAKILLRYIPKSLKHFLRKIEIYSNFHKMNSNRHVAIEGAQPPLAKNIIIVDDAIDTGFSFKSVYDFLIARNFDPQKITTAVLTTTSQNPIFKADISLFYKKIFAFPWSYDSKEYNLTWQFYKKAKESIST
jgi:hypoxanthine phosphoribosyltransferase